MEKFGDLVIELNLELETLNLELETLNLEH